MTRRTQRPRWASRTAVAICPGHANDVPSLPGDCGALDVDGVRQLQGLALRRPDAHALHLPVAGVFDVAGLFAFGRDVREGDADDGFLRQSRGREDALGPRDLHVLNTYVAELA